MAWGGAEVVERWGAVPWLATLLELGPPAADGVAPWHLWRIAGSIPDNIRYLRMSKIYPHE